MTFGPTPCDVPDRLLIRRVLIGPPLLLPLAGARVAAGFPSPADEYLEDFLDLNQLLVSERESTFLVRVKGTSMIGAAILPGDLLVVDRAREARDGDIVIAVIDGDLTVKRLGRHRGRLALLAENPQFPPLVPGEGQELRVWGVVSHCIHSYRRPGAHK